MSGGAIIAIVAGCLVLGMIALVWTLLELEAGEDLFARAHGDVPNIPEEAATPGNSRAGGDGPAKPDAAVTQTQCRTHRKQGSNR